MLLHTSDVFSTCNSFYLPVFWLLICINPQNHSGTVIVTLPFVIKLSISNMSSKCIYSFFDLSRTTFCNFYQIILHIISHEDRDFFDSRRTYVPLEVLPWKHRWNNEDKLRIKNKRVMKLSVSGPDTLVRTVPGRILKSSCWVMCELYSPVDVPSTFTAFSLVKHFHDRESKRLLWFIRNKTFNANPVLLVLFCSGVKSNICLNHPTHCSLSLYFFTQFLLPSFFLKKEAKTVFSSNRDKN